MSLFSIPKIQVPDPLPKESEKPDILWLKSYDALYIVFLASCFPCQLLSLPVVFLASCFPCQLFSLQVIKGGDTIFVLLTETALGKVATDH